MHLRRLAVILGAVAAVAVVAGCGSSARGPASVAAGVAGLEQQGYAGGGPASPSSGTPSATLDPTSTYVHITGELSGIYHRLAVNACDSDLVAVVVRPLDSIDAAVLTVRSDRSIQLSSMSGNGVYLGSGGSMVPGKGLTVDADLTSAGGRHVHVTGYLAC